MIEGRVCGKPAMKRKLSLGLGSRHNMAFMRCLTMSGNHDSIGLVCICMHVLC